jgi:hypothetical protein
MSAEKILGAWKRKILGCLLAGRREDYYIDMLMNYAENHMSESDFF